MRAPTLAPPRPRSSRDKTPASGAGCVGSNPTEGADQNRCDQRIHAPGRRGDGDSLTQGDAGRSNGWDHPVIRRVTGAAHGVTGRNERARPRWCSTIAKAMPVLAMVALLGGCHSGGGGNADRPPVTATLPTPSTSERPTTTTSVRPSTTTAPAPTTAVSRPTTTTEPRPAPTTTPTTVATTAPPPTSPPATVAVAG